LPFLTPPETRQVSALFPQHQFAQIGAIVRSLKNGNRHLLGFPANPPAKFFADRTPRVRQTGSNRLTVDFLQGESSKTREKLRWKPRIKFTGTAADDGRA
jgi:hypothetical protein